MLFALCNASGGVMMYDLEPPFLGPRRVRRDFLSPEDAAAMFTQRRRVDLSKMHTFYPPVTTAISAAYRLPLSTSQSIYLPRDDGGGVTDFIENCSTLPEVVTKRRTYSIQHRGSIKKPLKPLSFDQLPEAVLDTVVQQLKIIHLGRLSSSCTTCYMRDLVALQMTSRTLGSVARRWLYTDIDIAGEDSLSQLKKRKMRLGSRLSLLRRTLRANGKLAELVKKLNVPDPDLPLFLPNGQPNAAFDEYRDLVASVVMACPNMERLTGFYAWYNHEYDRLTHALSTRQRLRSHVWIISENDEIEERSQVQLPPGIMTNEQVDHFVHYNSWAKLEDLMMCSPGGAGVMEHHVFVKTFHNLPSLKRLCVSSFDVDDFTNSTLLSLPQLKCLRLEECSGVTDAGLSRWAATPATDHLESLTLVHQDIHSLLTISKMLASMPRLVKFTVVQSDVAPTLPTDAIVFQPLLASSSLEHLHWDIDDRLMREFGENSTPNTQLASSILHGGFPLLKLLRAPRDVSPLGALQRVCRPAVHGRVLRHPDKYVFPAARTPLVDIASNSTPSRGNSLRSARVRAQNYIDENSRAPREFMRVIITDHSRTEPFEDEPDSATSSNYSGASTELTDPNDMWSPVEPKLSDMDFDFGGTHFSNDVVDDAANPLGDRSGRLSLTIPTGDNQRLQQMPIPPRSPLRPRPILPLTVSEFKLPVFVGRIATTSGHAAPRFHLAPDIEGLDGNGGLVGWGDLLRVNEKINLDVEDGKPWIRDGCTGAWSKGQGKSAEWWRHTERPRRRLGRTIEVDHFF